MKQNIKYVNWSKDVIDPQNSTWMLPQILAHIGSTWPIAKVGDKYSFTATLKAINKAMTDGTLHLDGTPMVHEGCGRMLRWLNTSPRGEILGSNKQTVGDGVRWSAPVPLVLSAFKQYRGVGYNLWDWTDPHRVHFLDRDVMEWSNHFYQEVPWDQSQLLNWRDVAMSIKSGVKAGTVRSPISTTSVFGVTDPSFRMLPRLMKLSLTQLWCFHPRVRTDLMITNHMDLDSHPEPLVDGEVILSPQQRSRNGARPITEPTISDSPWDV